MLSNYTKATSSTKREQQQRQVSHSSKVITNISKSLETLRNRKLTMSKELAVELRKLAVPKLDNDKINKSEKKIKKRFNSVVGKFANSIEKNYPVVLSSPKRLTELHEMRKDCKKLRYLFELLPIGTNDKDEGKDKVSQLIEELEKVQDMLGTIHDYDTTIAYTKKYTENHPEKRASVSSTIKYLFEERHKSSNNSRISAGKIFLTLRTIYFSTSLILINININNKYKYHYFRAAIVIGSCANVIACCFPNHIK